MNISLAATPEITEKIRSLACINYRESTESDRSNSGIEMNHFLRVNAVSTFQPRCCTLDDHPRFSENYIEEYRQRVEGTVLEIVETHPTIATIGNGEAVTDWQRVVLELTLG